MTLDCELVREVIYCRFPIFQMGEIRLFMYKVYTLKGWEENGLAVHASLCHKMKCWLLELLKTICLGLKG